MAASLIDRQPESSASALITPPERADEIFLEGPRSRFAETVTLLKVMRDFLRGFRVLRMGIEELPVATLLTRVITNGVVRSH